MRFLCLHGMGTNSQIFEAQTAAIRHELGDSHSYDFVEGTVPHPMAPGIASFVDPADEFFTFVDKTSPSNCLAVLDTLETYVTDEGPFDGVMAFSEGAGLAAMLIIRRAQRQERVTAQQQPRPLFRCAIFFAGAVPVDTAELERGKIQLLDHASDGELIAIPTAHVWGKNDKEYPTFGPVLSRMCKADLRSVFIHEGGHEVLGPNPQTALVGTVQVIRRTIAAALDAQ